MLEPVQLSATSQAPADARHTVPAFPAVCAQEPAPLQASTVQTFPSLVQAVPLGLFDQADVDVVG